MLYTQAVHTKTLELLKTLMSDGNLPSFRLVGGTSLALLIGHRISVDLDLFCESSFDEVSLNDYLRNRYGLRTEFIDRETVKGEIDGVQIDCIAHRYPWIRPSVCEDGIRLASMEDVCAMKLNAIVGNGTRIKDFIDVAYLTERFTFNQMLDFFEEKYGASRMLPIKAVTYFEDINTDEPVRMLDGNKLDWKRIAHQLVVAQSHPDRLMVNKKEQA